MAAGAGVMATACVEHLVAEPVRGCCVVCQSEVLTLTVDGRPVVVEAAEVLPEHPCPSCEQSMARGQGRSECSRCGLSGVIGEPVPLRGVALAEDGSAREYRRRSFRAGEAAHAFHSCAIVDGVPERSRDVQEA